MAVFQKSGRKGWQVQVYAGTGDDGRKRYLNRSAATKKEALQLEAELKVAVAAGKERPASGKTLADALAAYLEHFQGSESTRYGYGLVIKRLPDTLTTLRLRQVTPEKLDAYYRSLRRQGYSNSTVRNAHALIRSVLNRAVKWGWIGSNPALNSSPGPTRAGAGRVATEAEVRALLAGDDPDLVFAIRLACATGLRRSELAALQWSDIDFEAGTLTVSKALVDAGGRTYEKGTKTNSARVIPLGPATLEMLRARRGIGPVFMIAPGPGHTPVPASPRSLSNRLAALADAVGIEGPDFGWHSFRHYAGTSLAGVADLRTVADILGHSTLRTTERYVHALAERSRAAVNALDGTLG
ncbi:MAG: tyrosine-type recombinase/integrase [Acidimicrobiia bacterium]